MIAVRPPTVAILLASAAAGAAHAHILLSEPTARAGGVYVAEFRVGHGCAGSATTALEIDIPTGIVGAKPQPKPGWTLDIRREPLAVPVRGEGGAMVRERVAAVTWRGRLADETFDRFALMVRLPPQTGPLYFPAVQTCEQGETRWTDIPAPGAAWTSVPHPAPVVTLSPAGEDAMAGMHP